MGLAPLFSTRYLNLTHPDTVSSIDCDTIAILNSTDSDLLEGYVVRADVSKSPKLVSQLGKRKKSPKGTVAVQAFKEQLRLCWSYQSKRYFLYLELPEGKTNRIVAEGKAKQIEGDIATGNFDRTLVKYKPDRPTSNNVTVVALFEKFISHKTKQVYKQTLAKYKALLGYINQFFRSKADCFKGD